LHKAVMSVFSDFDLDTVEFLLEQGLEVDLKDNSGMTALWYAGQRWRRALVELLLARRADPVALKERDVRGRTVLHSAVILHRSVENIEFLLEQGIAIDTKDDMGRTALWYACWHDVSEVVRLLLERVGDYPTLKEMDSTGRTLLYAMAIGLED